MLLAHLTQLHLISPLLGSQSFIPGCGVLEAAQRPLLAVLPPMGLGQLLPQLLHLLLQLHSCSSLLQEDLFQPAPTRTVLIARGRPPQAHKQNQHCIHFSPHKHTPTSRHITLILVSFLTLTPVE